jgi:hypothetical protein
MSSKFQPAIDRRVEWLGRMNDRRLAAFAVNNLLELEQIAYEYEEHKMLATAKEIRIAISVRKQVQHEIQPEPTPRNG